MNWGFNMTIAANDGWFTMIKEYDKLEHLGAGILLVSVLSHFMPKRYAFFITIMICLLWEFKDALLPWQTYGWFGGNGFSVYDLAAGVLGALIMTLVLIVKENLIWLKK